jgi:ATP-dependent protease ClpP protease subunit
MEDIGEPTEWTEELNLIDSATELDTIVLNICTHGGSGDTAALFNRALRCTAAHTVAIIGPSCASAGSIIALSAKEWILDETSSLMCHTSTYGMLAKDTDIFEHANFARKQLRSLFESVYSGFMSPDEIQDLIKGTPLYFDAEDLEGRLDNLTEYRNSKSCNCEECIPDNDEELDENISLEEIISEIVDKKLAEKDKPKKPSAKLTKSMKEAEEIKKKFNEGEDE